MRGKLNVVHIGKCGGSTVKSLLNQSSLLAERFESVVTTHISKVKYSKNHNYLIIIRNPIDRAISAFNWRYHLVVETERQRNRFRGEWQILKNYSTLNSLSEKLYDSNNAFLNKRVSAEFRTIHHLREDISYYLSNMLQYVQPGQVYGIIMQHSLADDCKSLLGTSTDIACRNEHGSSVDLSKKELSVLARKNLRRFLHQDFVCILKLYNLGLMDWRDYELLNR